MLIKCMLRSISYSITPEIRNSCINTTSALIEESITGRLPHYIFLRSALALFNPTSAMVRLISSQKSFTAAHSNNMSKRKTTR